MYGTQVNRSRDRRAPTMIQESPLRDDSDWPQSANQQENQIQPPDTHENRGTENPHETHNNRNADESASAPPPPPPIRRRHRVYENDRYEPYNRRQSLPASRRHFSESLSQHERSFWLSAACGLDREFVDAFLVDNPAIRGMEVMKWVINIMPELIENTPVQHAVCSLIEEDRSTIKHELKEKFHKGQMHLAETRQEIYKAACAFNSELQKVHQQERDLE